jgi:ABC-type cobalamin/Fe3+-siderophores transport system ATPase subunit
MPQNVIPRYSEVYRRDEIDFILSSARQGESLCLMGVAGVGKSNIVNFLRNIKQNAPHVEQDVARLHFPIVDATQWQGTANSLWLLMLDALRVAISSLPADPSSQKVIPISEDERAFKYLQARLDYVCQQLNHQVMFVLDDFDRAIELAPLEELERLNILRSAGNRGALSYLVLTKKLPHVLGSSKNFGQNSKFYDLYKNSVYALEPYNRNDALRMLAHLNQKADSPLAESQLEQVYGIAGGHAGLLKAVFNLKKNEPALELKNDRFANKPDIRQECERIFSKLHQQEQQVSLRVALGKSTPDDEPTIKHLENRGLLVRADSVHWFSPLMGYFLRGYQG